MGPGTPVPVLLLAPLHAVGLVGTPPRTLIRSWVGAGAIVAAILLVSQVAQPWRGMIQLGVAAALAIGVVALGVRYLRTAAPLDPEAANGRDVGPVETGLTGAATASIGQGASHG